MDPTSPGETTVTSGEAVATPSATPPKSAKNLVPFILGGIVALLLLAYLGLCAFVGFGGQILPNVSVAGLQLGGMTVDSATDYLTEHGTLAGQTVTLSYGGDTVDVDGALVSVDVATATQAAYDLGREGNFFTYGGQFFAFLFGEQEMSSSLIWLEEGEAQMDALLDVVSTAMGGDLEEASWEVVDDSILVYLGQAGTGVDTVALRETILAAFGTQETAAISVEISVVDPQPVDLQAIRDQIYCEPVNATLDSETFAISDSSVGVDFDVNSAQALVDSANLGDTVTISLIFTQPSVPSETFEALLFRDVLGEATTTVSGTTSRKSNVALAASACNESILLPGDEFSYNNTTGPRTLEKGYLNAPSYVGGESVDSVGGGICQVSSTIYLASLRAGLEIVERYNHSYVVGYVPDGMDATVYYGSLDFRFANDTDYPIKVVTSSYVSSGTTYLTVKIYGTKLDNITHVMSNAVLSTTAWSTEYVFSDAVAVGSKVQTQTPYTGKKVEVYRSTYDGDTLISTTLETSNTYKSRNSIYEINPADAALYGLASDGTALPEGYTEPEAEAETEAVPETTPEVEVTPEPVPETTPEVEVTPEPVPETTPEVEVTPEPVPETTPEVEVTPEPVPETTPEPEPEASTESSTGGADIPEGIPISTEVSQ